ncbi:MAG: type II toxin-antitoxin system HicB family antitoxin [Caldilineaceae bacterium]|nr:type II toxin-antitoxin system HicB family antitoxin [Caldilineaceae bacterium]MBP8125452.1 type II toxin-antitoxin system HicB family antitoxin [Caldilineaceae bacterium]MBP9075080.1 type II toxin-antitoxin system HicB family antitoxin [Caldilineaceae bacterium]
MSYSFSIFYSEKDGGYIADIPDLRFCSAFGNTPEDALSEVQIAKTAWLEAAQTSGKTIPSPFFKANRTKI